MQKRILVVRTDRVGDVVMITPMIRELRRTFPGAFIATLTNPNSADVLLNNPHLDDILIDEPGKKSFMNVVSDLRNRRFTDGLLLMPTKRAAYQMFLSGIRNRIGVGRKPYEVITFMKSVSRNKYIPLRYEADYCMDLARAIGVVSDDLTPEIFVTDDERVRGMELLKNSGSILKRKRIIIHTGSGRSSPNWSEDKYLELVESLLKQTSDSEIILTAREMSEEYIERSKQAGGERVVDARKPVKRLRDMIQIIANADFLIAASTGPLHIASALGRRTVGLYCHNKVNCTKLWGALGRNSVNLEVSKEYCDANCSADKEVCSFENGIGVEEVIREIMRD
ncbi:MAG: glycosyltransferase family 9 protein [Ignavibacteria bacterium]|nr:glycosyltransferase family 9 protein [Ignavibacteria bacterium]